MPVTIAKKPIIATAKKVANIGEGEDVLKIEIPFADDVEKLRASMEGEDMDKVEIEKILDEKLSKLKRSEVIDNINVKTDRIKERTESIGLKMDELETKFSEHLGKLETKFGEHLGKETETCEGVECIKNKLEDIDSKTGNISNRIDGVENKLGERISTFDMKMSKLEEVLSRMDTRTDTAVCGGVKGCNSDIPKGSSYCPNCGRQISLWKNLPDWVHFSKRK